MIALVFSKPIQLTLLVCFISLVTGCDSNRFHTVRRARILMDTAVSISLHLARADQEMQALSAIEDAFREVARIDSVFSSYREDSEISAINSAARQMATASGASDRKDRSHRLIPVSADVSKVLQIAAEVSEASDGAFDITIAPVLELWGFGSESPRVPSKNEIISKLGFVNFRNLQYYYYNEREKVTNSEAAFKAAIGFKQAGMAIDVGGIAKGYAVDRAIETLAARGYSDAMVEAGGDLRTIASELTAGRRHIWIRHPSSEGEFFARFRMDSGAVATSGDYERSFEANGVRYHHILNPQTGYPAGMDDPDNRLHSVTVKAPNATLADAFSTALFVLGVSQGLTLANQRKEIEAVFIFSKSGELYWQASAGLTDEIEILGKVNEADDEVFE